jgi:hypothetical protein
MCRCVYLARLVVLALVVLHQFPLLLKAPFSMCLFVSVGLLCNTLPIIAQASLCECVSMHVCMYVCVCVCVCVRVCVRACVSHASHCYTPNAFSVLVPLLLMLKPRCGLCSIVTPASSLGLVRSSCVCVMSARAGAVTPSRTVKQAPPPPSSKPPPTASRVGSPNESNRSVASVDSKQGTTSPQLQGLTLMCL